MVVGQPRRRCGGLRSRTGCLICRQRRLKCDETAPACRRCEIAGWQCEYAYGKRARQIRWKCSGEETLLPSTHQKISQAPTQHPDLSITESKAIAYFSQVAAGEMFGYLISDLWTRLVPQRYHASKTVRSAVVALSCAHQDHITGYDSTFPGDGDSTARSRRLDRRYGEALVQLQDYIERDDAVSKLEVLLTCLALVCCTLIRRQRQEAILHLDHGLDIVQNWEQEIEQRGARWQNHPDNSDFEAVSQAFSAVDMHATAYDDSRRPRLTPSNRDTLANFEQCTFDRFQSLEDAQQVLNCLIKAAFEDLIECIPYRFSPLPEVPQQLIHGRTSNRLSFKKWLVAFKSLEMEYQTRDSPGEVERSKIRITRAAMRAQHLSMETLLNETLCDGDNTGESPFDTTAAQLLQWAELAMPGCESAASIKPGGTSCTPLQFSLDLGFAPPLSLLALKSSRVDIREQAISALRRIPRVEGWYDPLQTANALSFLCACHPEDQAEHSVDALDADDVSTIYTSLEWPVDQLITESFGDCSAGMGRVQELGPFSKV